MFLCTLIYPGVFATTTRRVPCSEAPLSVGGQSVRPAGRPGRPWGSASSPQIATSGAGGWLRSRDRRCVSPRPSGSASPGHGCPAGRTGLIGMSNGDAEPPVSPACCSRSDHVNLMPFSLLRARLPAARAFGAAACLANLLVCAPSAGAGSLGLRYQSTRLIYMVQCIWNNHHPTEPLLLEF